MLQSCSPLLALNFLKDTIILQNLNGQFNGNMLKTFEGLQEKAINKRYDLKIIIDTTYLFSTQGIIYKNLLYAVNKNILKDSVKNKFYRNKLPFDTIRSLIKKFVSAYPVLYYNNSNRKIPLGTSDLEMNIIQEAKDIDGKWKPIEFRNPIGSCIPPLNLLLQPKHYSVSGIINYNGNFKTKIRVKYFDGKNTFYSNEINGTINRSQFNQEYLLDFYRDTHNGSYPRYFNDFKKRIFLSI